MANENLPYAVMKYPLIDVRYITFFAKPAKYCRFDNQTTKPRDYDGKWQYKAQYINGAIWISVDMGEYAYLHGETRFQVIRREAVRVRTEDWDKIYKTVCKVLHL